MAERPAVLGHLAGRGSPARGCTLSELPFGSVVQVVAWPQTLAQVELILRETLAMALPAPGGVAERAGISLVATGPGRFLASAATDDLSRRLEAAMTSEDGAVTDLSHARILLRLEGATAESVLAGCVPVDLAVSAFPPGHAAQTAIHGIGVLIARRDPTSFDIWAPRSFAEALAEWLLDVAEPAAIAFSG